MGRIASFALSTFTRSARGFLILVPVTPLSFDDFGFDVRSVCGEVKKSWIVLIMAGKHSDRFDIVNGKQLALLIAPTLCLAVAAAAVAARWYTRSVRRVNTINEDALMLAALVRRWNHDGGTMLTTVGYELCRSYASLRAGVPRRRRAYEL